MIGVLDYGVGNTRAFTNLFKKNSINSCLISRSSDFRNVDKIILPGVGSFDYAMTRLHESGLVSELLTLVDKGMPLLGVCVGMQMLGKGSDEGKCKGLSLISGRSIRFDMEDNFRHPLPHMGWNTLNPRNGSLLFSEKICSDLYFLHSYYFSCDNSEDVAGITVYGDEFCSAVQRDNIFGIQCHPEKSHRDGESILKKFSEV